MAKFLSETGLARLITKIKTALSSKQDTLVSGTNIKTVNGNSMLGSGDVTIASTGATVVQTTGTSTSDVMSQNATTDAIKDGAKLTLPQANSIVLGQNWTLYEGSKLYNKSIFFTAGIIAGSTAFTGDIQMWSDDVGRAWAYLNNNTLTAYTSNDYHTIFAMFFDENGYVNVYNRGVKIYTGTSDLQGTTEKFGLRSGTKLYSCYLINENLENMYLSYIFGDGRGKWYPESTMITEDYKTLSWTNAQGRTAVQVDKGGCWWEVDYSFTNDTSSDITGCQLPCQGTLYWDSNGRTGAAFSVSANSTYSGKCIVITNVNYLVLADSAGNLKQTVTAKRIIVENGIDARLCVNDGYFNPHLLTYVTNTGLNLSATDLIEGYITSSEAHGYIGQLKIQSGIIYMWNGSVWKQINNS